MSEEPFERDRRIIDDRARAINLASANPVANAFGRLQEIVRPAMNDWIKKETEEGGTVVHGAEALMGFMAASVVNMMIEAGMPAAERNRLFAYLMLRCPQHIRCYERQLLARKAAERDPSPEALSAVTLPDFLKDRT